MSTNTASNSASMVARSGFPNAFLRAFPLKARIAPGGIRGSIGLLRGLALRFSCCVTRKLRGVEIRRRGRRMRWRQCRRGTGEERGGAGRPPYNWSPEKFDRLGL